MGGNQCEVRSFAVLGGGEADFRNRKRENLGEWVGITAKVIELRKAVSSSCLKYKVRSQREIRPWEYMLAPK